MEIFLTWNDFIKFSETHEKRLEIAKNSALARIDPKNQRQL